MKARNIDYLVSKATNVSLENIYTKCGKREHTEARYICMYLRNKYLKQSYNSLAKEWKYSNHTVTLTGIRNLKNHIETEKKLAAFVLCLEKKIIQNNCIQLTLNFNN